MDHPERADASRVQRLFGFAVDLSVAPLEPERDIQFAIGRVGGAHDALASGDIGCGGLFNINMALRKNVAAAPF
jgi:hypothetical protein